MKTRRVKSLLSVSGNCVFKATQAWPASAMLAFHLIPQETLWPEFWTGGEWAANPCEGVPAIPTWDVATSRAQHAKENLREQMYGLWQTQDEAVLPGDQYCILWNGFTVDFVTRSGNIGISVWKWLWTRASSVNTSSPSKWTLRLWGRCFLSEVTKRIKENGGGTAWALLSGCGVIHFLDLLERII